MRRKFLRKLDIFIRIALYYGDEVDAGEALYSGLGQLRGKQKTEVLSIYKNYFWLRKSSCEGRRCLTYLIEHTVVIY